MTWLLFGLLATTVPLFFFLVVVGGFVPLIGIVALAVYDGTIGMIVFCGIHLVVYGTPLYFAARFTTRWLYSLEPRWTIAGFLLVSAIAAGISFLPLYSLGHNASDGMNLYQLFASDVLK
jgi:hypothetical protein